MTFLFWLLAGLMLAVAVAVLLLPLLRAGGDTVVDSEHFRLAAYRTRLAELDQEVASGVLAPEEASGARLELERELLRAIPESVPNGSAASAPSRRTAVWIFLLVPPAAVLLYLHLGQPALIDAPPQAQLDRATLEDMARRLEATLTQSPDDPVGLRLLAKTYAALGRYEDSAEMMERVLAKQPGDPEVMVELSQALAGAAGGSYLGRPRELLERALVLDPRHRLGLWLAGGAAMESGDDASALHHWEQLLPLVDAPEAADAVRSLIAKVRAETPAAAAEALDEPSAPFRLKLKVELAPEFADETASDAVLYITARSSDGPPMPLAALRLQAADLPLEVTLDESNIMVPGTQREELARLDVTARISKSGLTERRAGDLIGEVGGVRPDGEAPVHIVIDRRAP